MSVGGGTGGGGTGGGGAGGGGSGGGSGGADGSVLLSNETPLVNTRCRPTTSPSASTSAFSQGASSPADDPVLELVGGDGVVW